MTGTEDAPSFGGPGTPIEYCVKMCRFPRTAQLDQVLARGELTGDLLEALAKAIAEFHDGAEIASADVPYGNASEVGKYALENFTQIGSGPAEIDAGNALASLRAWTEGQLERHRELIAGRKRQGRVRQCHGDLHLTNMVLLEGRIVVFDGIEFNAALSFVDVMSEIAFLLMDLDVREHPDLAWTFLNRYLEETGDYEGLPLLGLYRVYRSLVRAKVAYLEHRSGSAKAACLARYERHLALARRYAEPRPPGLILITHGVSGAGKTAQSAALIPRLGALRLRSDVERKRLAGLSAEAKTANVRDGQGYAIARDILDSGRALAKMNGIIDAQGRQNKSFDLGQHAFDMPSPADGVVIAIDNLHMARVARFAGAPMDKGGGVGLFKKLGDRVRTGEPLYRVYAEFRSDYNFARAQCEHSCGYTIGREEDVLWAFVEI